MEARRELRCSQCQWAVVCDIDAMIAWLQRHGRLRRAQEPEPALVEELFTVAAGQFSCPECGGTGLLVGSPGDEDEDWGTPRPCEICGQPIPAERVAALPETRVCATCKQYEEAGKPADPEYCPRCGAIMEVRQSRGPGIARYTMVCPECGAI
jgi:hypothetical protein